MNSRNGFICKENKNPDYNLPLYARPIPAQSVPEGYHRCAQFKKENDELRAKIEDMEKQEPVAQVGVHKTGGNAGIMWSARPLNEFDSLPLLRDGDRLYLAPGAQPAPSAPDPKTIRDLLNESGLCAYDREGDLAFMVAATKFAALAAAAPKPEGE
jgi:hypothetical protein